MKKALFALLMIAAISGNAQCLEIKDGFWKTKYYLGEKEKARYEVQLHLNKHDTEAATMFKKANKLSKWSSVFSLSSAAASIGVITAQKTSTKLVCAGLAVAGLSATLVTVKLDTRNERHARSHYNYKYGY